MNRHLLLIIVLILGIATILPADEKEPHSQPGTYQHDDKTHNGDHQGHMQHRRHHVRFKSEPLANIVTGEGKVIAVVPASKQIIVDHGDIKGFMDAMTMGYKVNPASLLDGINSGDLIRFTIDTKQKAIVKIEELKP